MKKSMLFIILIFTIIVLTLAGCTISGNSTSSGNSSSAGNPSVSSSAISSASSSNTTSSSNSSKSSSVLSSNSSFSSVSTSNSSISSNSSSVSSSNSSVSSNSSSAGASSSVSSYQATLTFNGPTVSHGTAYVCWIENESGTDIQNFYVCNRVVAIGGALTGTAIPYWKTTKYNVLSNIDGVTGASIQGAVGLSISRTLNIGAVRKFRVCFEIDMSLNSNTYFGDKPAYIYRSDVIDLDSLSSSAYNLSLYGWMSNDTTGTYGQAPITAITGWTTYKLMTDLSYIAPVTDMVSTLTILISKVN
jgi:hypothetical protein